MASLHLRHLAAIFASAWVGALRCAHGMLNLSEFGGQYIYLLTLDYAYGGSDLDRVSNVNTDTYWQPQTGALPTMNALRQM